jgi:hypothetical protein
MGEREREKRGKNRLGQEMESMRGTRYARDVPSSVHKVIKFIERRAPMDKVRNLLNAGNKRGDRSWRIRSYLSRHAFRHYMFSIIVFLLGFLFVHVPVAYSQVESSGKAKIDIKSVIVAAGPGLSADEHEQLSKVVTSFLASNRSAYSPEDLAGLRNSLSLLVKEREKQWKADRADPVLLHLVQQYDLLALENSLETFDLMIRVPRTDPPVSNEFAHVLSGIVGESFGSISSSSREAFVSRVVATMKADEENLFSLAGKQPLEEGARDRIEQSLRREAESLIVEMKANLEAVPQDTRASIMEGYLNRFASAVINQWHISTRSAVRPDISDPELLRQLQQEKQKRFEAMVLLNREISSRREIARHAVSVQQEAALRRSINDETIANGNISGMDAMLSKNVEALVPDSELRPSEDHGSAGDPTHPQIDSNLALTSFTNEKKFSFSWLVSGFIVVIVTIVLIFLSVGKYRKRLGGGAKLFGMWGLGILVLSVTPISVAVPNSGTEEDTSYALISRAKISDDLTKACREMIGSLEQPHDVPQVSNSLYSQIEPAALGQLQAIDRSRLAFDQKKDAAKAVLQIVNYTTRLPRINVSDETVGDLLKTYEEAMTSLRSNVVDSAFIKHRLAPLIKDSISDPQFGILYVATWSDEVRSALLRQWREYCALQVTAIDQGIAYGDRISSFQKDELRSLAADAFIRKLLQIHSALVRHIIQQQPIADEKGEFIKKL